MVDRSIGDHAGLLRSPDLRLTGIKSRLLRGVPPFKADVLEPDRAVFVHVRRGNFVLRIKSSQRAPMRIAEGSTVGIEDGRPHIWCAASAHTAGLRDGEPVELFINSIPRRMGVLQRLEDGVIVIPPDAKPFATAIRLSVELHLLELSDEEVDADDAVMRRCAEIYLIQMVRYSTARLGKLAGAPPRLAHDEHLLRAWSAYFSDPRRRWTVKALADAAGLGRTAFSERFRTVFGAPPLHTLTIMRMEQAEEMLRHSTAPLIEIAFTVGYNSEAAFVRAFQRQYGLPPGRFRSEKRGAGIAARK